MGPLELGPLATGAARPLRMREIRSLERAADRARAKPGLRR
jgi:hypothetical protein